jgi:hypothetical protein
MSLFVERGVVRKYPGEVVEDRLIEVDDSSLITSGIPAAPFRRCL